VPAPEAPDDGSVTASPVDRDAPNDGRWFAVSGEPGETVDVEAVLDNPSRTAQEVSLYLAELTIDDEGGPVVGAPGEGVGGWGAFVEPTMVVPAKGTAEATFRVTIPDDADPGDHLGAVVVESRPTGEGELQVVKRNARRLYVTVPGEASPALEIESVQVDVGGGLLPRTAVITVLVRNSGNVRLSPDVVVDGERARGSELLMSESVERYVVRRPVPLWGGPVRFPVTVDAGPVEASASATRWVVPWWVLLALFLLVVGALSLRELRRRLA